MSERLRCKFMFPSKRRCSNTAVANGLCNEHGPIDALCARHDITVEGIVALVDAMHRGEVGPPKRRVSEEFPTKADAWHDGWFCGWDDNLRHFRRLARGEEA